MKESGWSWLQLTANSFGQIGAVTSPINMKDIAASTTEEDLFGSTKTKTIERFPDAEIVLEIQICLY